MRWIATLALAGCATSPASPTGPSIASANFDDKLIGALCVRDVRCGVYETFADCVAAQPGPSPTLRAQREADVEAGVVAYDPVAAASCIDFIANAACSDLAIHDDWRAAQACEPFEHGAITNGGACNHGEECASSNCEAAPDGPSAGVCLAGSCQPIELTAGGVCGQGYPACGHGSTCIEGECRQGSPAGATCDDSSQCATGLACDLDRNVCAAPVHEGEVCGALPCAEIGLDCVASSTGEARCRRRADRGEACRLFVTDINDLPLCKSDFVCDLQTHVCVDAVPANLAAGAACLDDSDCASHDCVAGTCQAVAVCS